MSLSMVTDIRFDPTQNWLDNKQPYIVLAKEVNHLYRGIENNREQLTNKCLIVHFESNFSNQDTGSCDPSYWHMDFDRTTDGLYEILRTGKLHDESGNQVIVVDDLDSLSEYPIMSYIIDNSKPNETPEIEIGLFGTVDFSIRGEFYESLFDNQCKIVYQDLDGYCQNQYFSYEGKTCYVAESDSYRRCYVEETGHGISCFENDSDCDFTWLIQV